MVDPTMEPDRETSFGAPAPRFVRACVQLRAKSMYYRAEDQAQPPGMVADSDTNGYWCALTQDSTGPDQAACTPGGCQPGRGCFVPPVEV